MAHFTQLGLSEKPEENTSPNVSSERQPLHSSAKQLSGQQKTAVLVGALIATSLLGVFLLESGCSKESDKTATIAPPNQSVATQLSTPTATVPTSNAVASQPPAKKKSRQRKLSAATYTNPAYGVSFRYPKSGMLKEGDKANLELDGLGPVEMNFVQPGGTVISAVELPRKLYAGTDFNAAFFNVSVNPKMTADECEQFAFPESSNQGTDPVATSKTKVGATEFHAVEGFTGQENNQADLKYYHVFQNGSCYEFALGLETAADTTEDVVKDEGKPALKATTTKPVNRNEVFRKLNWILSTVKIQPVAAPKAVPEVATSTPTVPAETTITEAH
jgi:hypothetical protein